MLSLSYSGALDLQEQLYFSQFDGNCRYGQSLLKDLLRKISRNCDIAAKMKQLCYLIRTSHSSRSLSGTGYFLRWNRRGEFEH